MLPAAPAAAGEPPAPALVEPAALTTGDAPAVPAPG